MEERHTQSEAAKSHSCDKTEIICLGEDETDNAHFDVIDDAHFNAIDTAPINEVVDSTNWNQVILIKVKEMINKAIMAERSLVDKRFKILEERKDQVL